MVRGLRLRLRQILRLMLGGLRIRLRGLRLRQGGREGICPEFPNNSFLTAVVVTEILRALMTTRCMNFVPD